MRTRTLAKPRVLFIEKDDRICMVDGGIEQRALLLCVSSAGIFGWYFWQGIAVRNKRATMAPANDNVDYFVYCAH